jgi:phage tail-like protein
VRFAIARNGAPLGLFETCRGLGTATEVLEFRDGGDPNVVHKLPGRLQLSDVICTRSAADAADFLVWRALVVSGEIGQARSAVTISELDMSFQVVRSWSLTNAWPAELQAVGGTTGTVELLRIAHEGIERTQ